MELKYNRKLQYHLLNFHWKQAKHNPKKEYRCQNYHSTKPNYHSLMQQITVYVLHEIIRDKRSNTLQVPCSIHNNVFKTQIHISIMNNGYFMAHASQGIPKGRKTTSRAKLETQFQIFFVSPTPLKVKESLGQLLILRKFS